MVKAELSYNPYLLETAVKFNGQEPKINSLVEKYQNGMLQEWLGLIPKIFYDEMNGYDFELEYSGTISDFRGLVKAFEDAGVTEEKVHLFHKNNLESRAEKVEKIEKLFEWLAEHPNRKFDYAVFKEENKELFEKIYPYIVIHGSEVKSELLEKAGVSIECVFSVEELRSTVLSHTPILLCIERDILQILQLELRAILGRSDVKADQIFFYIEYNLDADKIERMLKDMGIPAPQIVAQVDDKAVLKYLETYPITDYIREAIEAFRGQTDIIQKDLEQENWVSAIVNKGVYEKLENLEQRLMLLKEASNKFLQRDNLDMPLSWVEKNIQFISKISNWKIKKTKMTKTEEAEKLAEEFDKQLSDWFRSFTDAVCEEADIFKDALKEECKTWYQSADTDMAFEVEHLENHEAEIPEIPMLSDTFKGMKKERYVVPKDDILGLFFKKQNNEPKEAVLETTWYYHEWREYAEEIIKPLAESVLQNKFKQLCEFAKTIAEEYMKHLNELIEQKTAEKDETALMLSEDERQLQNDNDWLAAFIEQVENIERG